MRKCLNILVFLPFLCFTAGRKLPSTFRLCSINDTNVEECFAAAIEQAVPLVQHGLPEYGIPPLDPLAFGTITIEGNPSSPVNLAQKLIDAKVHNLVNSKVKSTKLHVDDKNFKITVLVTNKLLIVESSYEMSGKILVLPITGNGDAHLEFHEVEVTVVMNGELYEKKNKRYVKITDLAAKLEPALIKFQFTNLFNGDVRLQAEMRKLFNENWKQIYEEIRAPYEEAISAILKRIFSTFFDKFPYDYLFDVKN